MPGTADHFQPPLEPPADPAALPCPVAVGDLVISCHTEDPAEYGGPSDNGFIELIVSFGGPAHVLKCDPKDVAPADVPIPEKDGRVQAVKRPRAEVPYAQPGPWRLTIAGADRVSWHKTKRDATATGLRQVAIIDWHARQAAAPSGGECTEAGV